MAASVGFTPESERVTRRLRDEIIDGVRVPGSRLVERELAESLGVSRLPVREALKTLVSEGLVTPRPRSWAVVREFTTSDIADLDEVRSGLETLGFRLAAQRHTREGLERLRATVDAELDAARADDAVRPAGRPPTSTRPSSPWPPTNCSTSWSGCCAAGCAGSLASTTT